jgi:arylsulfatase A-like enzyme
MIKIVLGRLLDKVSNRTDIFWKAVDDARSWTLTILFVFLAIKAALFFTEASIELEVYEWFLAPAAFSYQHLFASVAVFLLFLGIIRLGCLAPQLRYAALGLLGLSQIVLTFMHIAALRVEHILRTYPTFEMAQADAEASIFTSSLLDKVNLPYTLPGIGLSLIAILAPLLLFPRLKLRSVRVTWKKWLLIFTIWAGVGIGAEIGLTSDVGISASDPVIYFVADFFEKTMAGRAGRYSATAGKFDTALIFGDKTVHQSAHHFENLEKWRKTKKNVIFIVQESSPIKQVSYMQRVKVGDELRDTTPTLREMRDHMLTLENHYTVHPTSMNALFSIGCSLYPYPGGGIITHINPRIPCRSISEVFAEAGYKTALFHSGKFSFWAKRKFYNNRGFSVMLDAKSIPGHENAEQFKWGIEELVTARAVADFIEKNKRKPFFIQYIPVFPHVPYDFKDGDYAIFPKKRPRDKYHNCLRYADRAVKVVMDGLRRAKLVDDTLVVVVGDHGEAFLEHKGNRVHSIYIYEENVHVAAAFYNPILFPSHRKTERVTGHIDFLPTIADIVGLSHGRWWQGRSLLKDSPSQLTYFYANWGPELVGVRDGRYKAIYDLKKQKIELYDLERDGKEKQNLADQLKNRLPKYRRAITRWRDYHMKLIPNLGK